MVIPTNEEIIMARDAYRIVMIDRPEPAGVGERRNPS
jgi:hypothetical protein